MIRDETSRKPKTIGEKQIYKLVHNLYFLNPEEILTTEAMSTPHRTIVSPEELENKQIKILCNALKTQMKKELRRTE